MAKYGLTNMIYNINAPMKDKAMYPKAKNNWKKNDKITLVMYLLLG